jgi:hypothetical protein
MELPRYLDKSGKKHQTVKIYKSGSLLFLQWKVF